MDQFTNAIDTDANGNYDIQQAYPLSRFMILEHANPRYKPTGITVQACNEKKPTTYLGSAVDIAVLPGHRPLRPRRLGGRAVRLR